MSKHLDPEQVRKGLTPAAPTLEMHDELVALASDRMEKRIARRKQAEAEERDAVLCHTNAIAARLAFIAANPDPQLAIFQ